MVSRPLVVKKAKETRKSMKKCSAYLSLYVALSLLASLSLAGSALAQDAQVAQPHGMFMVMPPHLRDDVAPPAAALQSWNGSFTVGGTKYSYNMVGGAVEQYDRDNYNLHRSHQDRDHEPERIALDLRSCARAIERKLGDDEHADVPDFRLDYDLCAGRCECGDDPVHRCVSARELLGNGENGQQLALAFKPTVLAEQTLSPPRGSGKTGSVFGFTAALVDINWFDAQVPNLVSRLGMQPNTFPIFLVYDTYLTQGGSCCIGGYHSSEGSTSNPQSYAEAAYVDHPRAFSQDLSALSHEVGEWADDPLTVNFNGNNTPCGILEVGDPEEGDANFGGFPYGLPGFTYNLQDLVTLPYFGAPTSTSVNGWLSFQGNSSLSVCSNGS